jgi:hypothetical protein
VQVVVQLASVLRYTAFSYVALDMSESSAAALSPKSLTFLGRVLQSKHTIVIAVSTALEVPACVSVLSSWCKRFPALSGLRMPAGGLASGLPELFDTFSAMMVDLVPHETTPAPPPSGRSTPPVLAAVVAKPIPRNKPRPPVPVIMPTNLTFKPLSAPPLQPRVVPTASQAASPQGPRLILGCSCIHLGSPPCATVTALLRQFPTLCRMAAVVTAPYQCTDSSADKMWCLLADVVLTHGLFEVKQL